MKRSKIKSINFNNCNFSIILNWNNKYIIAVENKNIKIIDLECDKIITNIFSQHDENVKIIKKIFHPLFGESLLTSTNDNIIKLWIV